MGIMFSSKSQYGNNISAISNHLNESHLELTNGDGTVN